MKDVHIEELILVGVGAEAAVLSALRTGQTKVVARGERALHWWRSTGINSADIIQLNFNGQTEKADWQDQLRRSMPGSGSCSTLVYITPVQPLSIDLPAELLAKQAGRVKRIPGGDWVGSALPGKGALHSGAQQFIDILQMKDDIYPGFSAAMPALVYSAGVQIDYNALRRVLLQVYPGGSPIFLLPESPSREVAWLESTLENLNNTPGALTALYLPPCSADASLESFMQVIAKLRAPDGCPWDRKQTHQSLRPYLLEETYEALECLDNEDLDGLAEELGDLLLQIALHSQIASETDTFNVTNVLQKINRKIVSRHPHVFSATVVSDENGVIQNWEKIKELERAGNGKKEENGLLSGVPQILPALSQAQSIQERAARVGFDWAEIGPVTDKVMEEMREVQEAENDAALAEELGDLLFAVVNLARWHKVDAEAALRETNKKFRKRFAYIETHAKEEGKDLRRMTLDEMDALWDEAKTEERD